ncbi:MAG: FxLYD domain-containing protein [Coriobacteriaceae bacterium]|nr:FxLYD domain-containing protein [Coriobacteriaceae bacterium]
MKRISAALLSCLVALSLSACGQPAKDPGPDYADDEAMEIIADAFEARQDVIFKVEEKDPSNAQSMKNMRSYVEAELEVADKLRTRVFEDSEMQELVLKYLNTLDNALKTLEEYPVTSTEFLDEWNERADIRATLLKTFADEYGLTVEEKYQDIFDEVLANGAAAAKESQTEEALQGVLDAIVFEKVTEYSFTTYSAVVENTTGVDFGDCAFDVALYDAEGVKLDDRYVFTSGWASGEKVRFEFTSEVDTDQIKLSIDYYNLAK